MIVTAGLTPAWQQILLLDELERDAVNRAREVHWCASGKVLNAAMALHDLGAAQEAVVPVGGWTGASIREAFRAAGIPARWVDGQCATRVCTTLIESQRGAISELVAPAEAPEPAVLARFQAAYADAVRDASCAVLIGSLPRSTPPSYYHELLRLTPCRAILDIRGPELVGLLSSRPFLVKPNRQELARTLGRNLGADRALVEAMSEVEARGAKWVVVSDGPRALWAAGEGSVYRFSPPRVDAVNPIGSGDCMSAALAWALARGESPVDAIRLGVAAGSANAAQLMPAHLDPEEVKRLAAQVEVESP